MSNFEAMLCKIIMGFGLILCSFVYFTLQGNNEIDNLKDSIKLQQMESGHSIQYNKTFILM